MNNFNDHTARCQIREMVSRYVNAIHTQNQEDFLPLWNEQCTCTLISPAGYFVGIRSIYEDFLLGRIRNKYARIDLLTEKVDIRFVDERNAIVIFQYSTDCINREDGEPSGIAGLETQNYALVDHQWKLTHVHYSVDPR